MSHHRPTKKNPGAPMTNVCIYRVKPGKEAEFAGLLDQHWPTLNKLGLVTADPVKIHRVLDRAGRVCYVEIFTWINNEGPEICHRTPEVMKIWEPMGAVLDDMEFLESDD